MIDQILAYNRDFVRNEGYIIDTETGELFPQE